MQYRQLGKLDRKVSEIGFGAWGIGGDAYGRTSDSTSALAVHAAIEQGINFFDTSDLYGNGHSEEILGAVFKEFHVRQSVFIATKFGTLPHSGFKMPQDFSVAYMQKSLESSLRRLRTDYLDLYQVHSPPVPFFDMQELEGALIDLKKEGKIRAYGISVRNPGHVNYFETIAEPDTYQFNFNIVDDRPIKLGLLEYGAYGKIARTPFCFGFLTGTVDIDRLEETDHRKKWPKAQLQRWASASTAFDSLIPAGWTKPQFCLAYCLSHAINVVIPGMLSIEEVEEDCKASDLRRLDTGELLAIEQICKDNNYFFDPTSKGEQ